MEFRQMILRLLLAWSVLNVKTGSALSKQQSCPDEEVTCPCGSQHSYVMVSAKMCYDERRKGCFACKAKQGVEDLCQNYYLCETCLPGLDRCYTCPKGTFGPYCRQGNVTQNSIYPIVFTSFDSPDHPGRRKRQDALCSVPISMTHADYKCWKWPDRLRCDVHCHEGYALALGGTKKRIRCINGEGDWKPRGWADCLPYVNCDVGMKSPGHFFCKYDMSVPAFCFFTCDATDTESAYPRTKHICEGHWDPELPHCIKTGAERSACTDTSCNFPTT